MKQQFVVTHTIRQRFPYYQTVRLQIHLLSKCHSHKKKSFSSYFRENETRFRIGILRIGQILFRILYNSVYVDYGILLFHE